MRRTAVQVEDREAINITNELGNTPSPDAGYGSELDLFIAGELIDMICMVDNIIAKIRKPN